MEKKFPYFTEEKRISSVSFVPQEKNNGMAATERIRFKRFIFIIFMLSRTLLFLQFFFNYHVPGKGHSTLSGLGEGSWFTPL